MKIHGINSDEYIYYKLDIHDKQFPFPYDFLEKGSIIRFKVEELRKFLWRSSFLRYIDYFDFVLNPKISKYDFSPKDLYKSITVKKSIDFVINMRANDILLINEELWNKLNSTEPLNKTMLGVVFGCEESKSPVERNHYHLEHTLLIRYDGTECVGSDLFDPNKRKRLSNASIQKLLPEYSEISKKEKLIDCYRFGNDEVLVVPLREGEVLDFNSLVYNLLFLSQDWMRMLSNMTPLSEKEQLKHFENDFKGYIPEAKRRYFRLHDYIKIKSLKEIFKSEVFELIRKKVPSFQNPVDYFHYERYSTLDNFDFDSDGYLRYIWCSDDDNFFKEYEFSKIADRVSYDEGLKHYTHEKALEELLEEENNLKRIAEDYVEKHCEEYQEELLANPNLSHIEFMNKQSEEKKILVKRLIRTLNCKIPK